MYRALGRGRGGLENCQGPGCQFWVGTALGRRRDTEGQDGAVEHRGSRLAQLCCHNDRARHHFWLKPSRGVAWDLGEGGLSQVRSRQWGTNCCLVLTCVLGALALAAYNPASGCEMEIPRQRFLSYCSLATTLLIPDWPSPGTYLVRSVPPYPLPLPPQRGRGGERT